MSEQPISSYQWPEASEPSYSIGVCFDAEHIVLHGTYTDELSAHRARKAWAEILEYHFLLENGRDFAYRLTPDYEHMLFTLECEFLSACGRYAFWRLTNHQAPEAQYQIETAHIPESHRRQDEFLSAPDLRPLYDEPLVTRGLNGPSRGVLGSWLKRVMDRIQG